LGHQRHGRHRAPEATRLAALRDDHVDPEPGSLLGLSGGVDLLHEEAPGLVRPLHQLAGAADGERDDPRSCLEREPEASSSSGRAVWFTANGRSVSSRT